MTTISPVATPMSDPFAGIVTSIATAVTGIVAEVAKLAEAQIAASAATGQAGTGADFALGGPEARGTAGLDAGVLDSIAGAFEQGEGLPVAAEEAGDVAPPPPGDGGGAGQKAVDVAKSHEGVPYVWGGTTPEGFDCSGLTSFALREAGIEIPRTSQEQFNGGTPVEKDDLQPGDLVFFYGDPPGHVGIYAGDGMVTHAPTTGDVVKTVPLDSMGDYSGARRYT